MRKTYYKITAFLPKGIKAQLDNSLANKEWRQKQTAKIRVWFNRLKRGVKS